MDVYAAQADAQGKIELLRERVRLLEDTLRGMLYQGDKFNERLHISNRDIELTRGEKLDVRRIDHADTITVCLGDEE